MSFVIAISGPSGFGKTTIQNLVTELLPDAVALYWDDFTDDDYLAAKKTRYPSDLHAWLADGFDLNLVSNPGFARALRELCAGRPIPDPQVPTRQIHPATYVVTDESCGREREETADCIDFVAAIDLPLDVSIPRLILRRARTIREVHTRRRAGGSEVDWEKVGEELSAYVTLKLGQYLSGGKREATIALRDRMLAKCDLALDGTLLPDELAGQVVEAVAARHAEMAQEAEG